MRPLRKVEVKRLFADAAKSYPPKVELAFLLQSVEDPLNVGSMFRIADACGARELVFTGATPSPPHEDIERTARGHERRVAWRRIGRMDEAGNALRDEGYHLVALEMVQGAVCYLEYDFPRQSVFGARQRDQRRLSTDLGAVRWGGLYPHVRQGAVDECSRGGGVGGVSGVAGERQYPSCPGSLGRVGVLTKCKGQHRPNVGTYPLPWRL